MKTLFDLLPVMAFVAAYVLAPSRGEAIYVATAAAIVAAAVQVLAWRAWRGGWERMQVITLLVLVVLGGATLWLRDPRFIMWKPTIVYWLMGAALLGARLLAGRNLIAAMLGGQVRLPPRIWDHLNVAWAAFFAAMGVVNLWVAWNFPEAVWVQFKLFGLLGLTLAFTIAQAIYMARHVLEPGPSTEE